MSDRVYLEQTEAKEMLENYNRVTNESGKVESRKWLESRIGKLERIYGNGFSNRVRGYMRELDDKDHDPKIERAIDRGINE